jgi:PAS domain-containing protein
MGGGGAAEEVTESLMPTLKMLGSTMTSGLVVFDSQKKIVYLNGVFEELSGIRVDAAVGQEMSQVARDQAMGALTNDLLDRAPVGGDSISEGFDFSGISYKVYASAVGAPGGQAKCFVLGTVRSEG